MQIKNPAGRPKRSDVDRFQTMAWFNSISNVMNDCSPTHLERIIQPENVTINNAGKLITSRAWDKYKAGDRLPSDTILKEGKSSAVLAAEKFVPESADVFRHPLWIAMRMPVMSFVEVMRLISTLPPSASHFYMDLSETLRETQASSFSENVGLAIWIECNDYRCALDHLAAQLMILRLDIFRHIEILRISCAYNIEKTLGPIAISPWFEPFHEEMFDWLEANVWGDLFDNFYDCAANYGKRGDDSAKGWRKTKPQWLILDDEG